MSYFAGSPWTDAAQYGQGLGQSLSQAMLQMPQQRYELAAQQAQMRATQQRNMLELALQNRAQQAQQQLGLSELNLHQQEMQHNNEYHQSDLQIQQQKADNAAKGTWRFGQDKNGTPYQINTITGEHRWLPPPDGGMQPALRPQDSAANDRQALIEGTKMAGGFGQMAADPALQKNNPFMYNQATNVVGQLAPLLIKGLVNRLGQSQNSLGVSQTNSPVIPTQTNAPGPVQLGTPSGLGMPDTTNGMGQRILKFNPATGGLE